MKVTAVETDKVTACACPITDTSTDIQQRDISQRQLLIQLSWLIKANGNGREHYIIIQTEEETQEYLFRGSSELSECS